MRVGEGLSRRSATAIHPEGSLGLARSGTGTVDLVQVVVCQSPSAILIELRTPESGTREQTREQKRERHSYYS